jgi:hypothetical protein
VTFLGTVHQGVVVLPEGVCLPEGASVRVEPVEAGGSEATEVGSIWDMSDLAVDTGIADLATNVDHYLYGHPKDSDAE